MSKEKYVVVLEQMKLSRLLFSVETGYPDGYCWSASLVGERWGLKRVSGFFRLDTPVDEDGSLIEPHGWNEDTEGRRWDMTLHQFNKGLAPENRVEDGVHIIGPDHPLFDRYCLKQES